MDCHVSFLDASVNVSGSINGYGQGIFEAGLGIEGNMGPEATAWVTNKIGLPLELRPRSPLAVSEGRVLWDKGSKTTFSGDFTVAGAPGVSRNVRRVTLEGKMNFSNEGPRLDMELSADDLNWTEVNKIIEEVNRGRGFEQAEKSGGSQLEGTLRVKLKDFRLGNFTWSPFEASILFGPDQGVNMVVTQANLCGISTPGTVEILPEGLQIAVTPGAMDQELAPAVACLWDKEGAISGRFDLTGELTAEGNEPPGALVNSLRGDLKFVANEGRIYRFGLLAKIFALLNAGEVFFGEFPDVVKEGFGYKNIKVRGEIQNGVLVVKEGIIDGAPMTMVIQGDISLTGKELDLKVMVAPFKTMDRMVKYVPVLGDIMGGHLVCIPIRVTGKLSDPQLTPLSPAAVGSELMGTMKRVLKFPLQLMQPFSNSTK